MAGAAQVPKHDWSLPTRPGLEIEDVSELETSSSTVFACALLPGGDDNRPEHLEMNVFKMMACLSSMPNPWSERC